MILNYNDVIMIVMYALCSGDTVGLDLLVQAACVRSQQDGVLVVMQPVLTLIHNNFMSVHDVSYFSPLSCMITCIFPIFQYFTNTMVYFLI